MSLQKEIEELRKKVKEFHNKANKIGWVDKHIFNVLGEIEYHKYDNVQGQLNEKEATLKERMKWLDRIENISYPKIDDEKGRYNFIMWVEKLKDLVGTKNE